MKQVKEYLEVRNCHGCLNNSEIMFSNNGIVTSNHREDRVGCSVISVSVSTDRKQNTWRVYVISFESV